MRFGILIFNGAEELDFMGPWEMLTMWKKVAGGPQNCLLVAEKKAPVKCAKGMSVNPDVSIDACPDLDGLLIPGGQGTRTEVNNPAMIDFIAHQHRHCQHVLSVCTGAFMLHSAGILSGKKATTHWGSLERLRAKGDVQVVEKRWVRDGNIWSAAGVSAGIDLMLAFIADQAGEAAAGQVQLQSEYFPESVYYGDIHRDPQAPDYLKG